MSLQFGNYTDSVVSTSLISAKHVLTSERINQTEGLPLLAFGDADRTREDLRE